MWARLALAAASAVVVTAGSSPPAVLDLPGVYRPLPAIRHQFVVLIADTSDSEGRVALERLQKALDRHNRNSRRGYDIRFSVGAVAYEPVRHSSIEALLADARMYERKRRKRAA